MPLYEFECECGKRKELITSVKTTSIECEDCGKDMKRLISLSSFKLKGTGWAFDNYGSLKTKTSNKKD